jgi:hypothetical protein
VRPDDLRCRFDILELSSGKFHRLESDWSTPRPIGSAGAR